MSKQYDQALERVKAALAERRRFGKHFANGDLPVEFLDDLLLIQATEGDGKLYVPIADYEALKVALTLSNRQLAASKAREGGLRKQLKELQEELADASGGVAGNSEAETAL